MDLERFHEARSGGELLHVGHEECDVVALGAASRGLDVVDGLELAIGPDHLRVEADVWKLLGHERGIRGPQAGIDHIDILGHRAEHRAEVLVAGAQDEAQRRDPHGLRLLLGLVGGATRPRGAVVEDGDLLGLEVIDSEDDAGWPLEVVAGAEPVDGLECPVGDLRDCCSPA